MDYRDIFDADPVKLITAQDLTRDGRGEVVSFIEGSHYAANFGKQWRTYRDTQLDSVNGTTISRDFLHDLLGEPLEWLADKSVIEVGGGAGRFTEYFARFARTVVTFDLSEAVFSNAALGAPNVVVAQADLWRLPTLKEKFDVVFCRGVLQHTPDPVRSIRLLYDLVKPGGTVIFDVYSRERGAMLRSKYLWRAIVRRVFTYESFQDFIDRHAEAMLRFHWRVKPWLPGASKYLVEYLVPIWDYRGRLPLSERQLIEWAKLDTLDALFARFDSPMRHRDVSRVLDSLGVSLLASGRRPGYHFFRTRLGGGQGE